MAKNFKSNKAYKSWLAYGHASGNQKVSIKGNPKKVTHEYGGPHDPSTGPTYVSSPNDPKYLQYLSDLKKYKQRNIDIQDERLDATDRWNRYSPNWTRNSPPFTYTLEDYLQRVLMLKPLSKPTQEFIYDEQEAIPLRAEEAFAKKQALEQQLLKEQSSDNQIGKETVFKVGDNYVNAKDIDFTQELIPGKGFERKPADKPLQKERRLTPMTFKHGGPHNPPKKRIKVGGTSITVPNINLNLPLDYMKSLGYAALPAAWVGGLVQGIADKKNKFEESPKGIIKQNKRKVVASYGYGGPKYPNGGPPYETETTEEVNEDAMDGMMKARIAYEVMHGNPAAKRLIAPTDEPIITEVEELDDEGYTRTYTNEGSHLMGQKDNVVVPYIQGSPGNLQLDLSYGKNSKEAMKFDSTEDAKYFANENYKRVSPAFQKTYGGPKYPSAPYYPYKSCTA